MLDVKVLAAVLDSRDAYDKVKSYVVMEELGLQAQTWWPLVVEWYDADRKAQSVDREILLAKGERELPEAHLSTLTGWLKDVPESNAPEAVVKELLELKRYVKGNELSQAIQGRADGARIDALLGEYSELRNATHLGTSEVTWTMDDQEMDSLLDRDNLIKFAPQRVNDRLKGGIGPGDTVLIFGRPEAGKSLFTVNAVAGFLKFKRKVLCIGNEEGTYRTRKRIICNLANTDNDGYAKDPEKALSLAKERGLDYLYICHMQPGSPAEIEELVKEVRPEVVVVDQIRNLTLGKTNDKLTDRLGELGTAMRSMANKYGFASVSVTQAGDKTERHGQEVPPWLTMADIADNRTSLAAQFDVILGVGCTEELRRNNTRAISICKNKLNDAADAHEGLVVQVNIGRSKVK